MSNIKEKFNLKEPLPTILPKAWSEFKITENLLFNNLDHFILTVSELSQKKGNTCDMSYEEALNKLIKRESDFPKTQQESIRELVRSNLFKRGLITHEVYEDFKYTSDGTCIGVDVGKYAAGEAECVISPSTQYVDFFYELYINVSYPYYVTNEDVRTNVAKLLATVEELERQHIFVKLTVVLPVRNVSGSAKNNRNLFSMIPIFSHKDNKSVDVMSSVVNDRLLRKFYFAIMEDIYGSSLNSTYGQAVELEKTMNIGEEFDEISFFSGIKENATYT